MGRSINHSSIMTSVLPHNPSNAPETPGYRFLGIGEQVKKTDETHEPRFRGSVWLDAGSIASLCVSQNWGYTVRRALCVDDSYAPPPDQWIKDGYQVSGPVTPDGQTKALKDEEYWGWTNKGWVSSHNGIGYFLPVYIRRKVEASAPSAPTLKPNQSIVVKTHGICPLSSAVQELAFKAGWHWNNCAPDYPAGRRVNHAEAEVLHLHSDKTITCTMSAQLAVVKDSLVLDAKTDLGQLIDLLEGLKVSAPPVPAAPVAPTINGHTARYSKGGNIISFGCADISTLVLQGLGKLMGLTRSHPGNRQIASITLDSGVKIGREDVRTVLAYIDQVNGANA